MRILLLADLHYRHDWYHWLTYQRSDLTVIAGDLLDGFRPGGLLPQMLWLGDWCRHFRGHLALSSGNHDANEPGRTFDREDISSIPDDQRQSLLEMASPEHWMDCLERPEVVTDGRTSLFETASGSLVLTTIPYNHRVRGDTFADDIWRAGARLRKSHRIPWLVLHHEPPDDTSAGGVMGDQELFDKIQEYQPSFVVSGHLHSQPYIGSFAAQIDGTWCFNPGFPVLSRALRTKVPNHILLDLANRTAKWHATANVGRSPIVHQVGLE